MPFTVSTPPAVPMAIVSESWLLVTVSVVPSTSGVTAAFDVAGIASAPIVAITAATVSRFGRKDIREHLLDWVCVPLSGEDARTPSVLPG